MEMLDQYFSLQQEIYEYFGYVEDWVVLPIDDTRDHFWKVDEKIGRVTFWKKYEDLEPENYFENSIYTQRHLSKWVYRGEDYTMILVDTHTDGNKFLQIFANALEVTRELP